MHTTPQAWEPINANVGTVQAGGQYGALPEFAIEGGLHASGHALAIPLGSMAVPHGQQSPSSLHRVVHCGCNITM